MEGARNGCTPHIYYSSVTYFTAPIYPLKTCVPALIHSPFSSDHHINALYEEVAAPRGPVAAYTTDRLGTHADFTRTFLLCFFLPVVVPLMLDRKQRSYRFIGGGVIGIDWVGVAWETGCYVA